MVRISHMPGSIPALLRTREEYNILGKLPVSVSVVEVNTTNSLHWHDYTQIWYTVSGEYYHTINGVRTLQTPGSVAVVYPYTFHAVDTALTDLEAAKIIYISIPNNVYVKNVLPFIPLTYSLASFDSFSLHPFMKLSGRGKELADDLCEGVVAEFSKNQAMIYNRIFNNIGKLLELCIQSVNSPLTKQEISIAHERALHISHAVNYLTDNSSEEIRLRGVSRSAMMSERSFTDKFKLTVGQTYHSYLTGVRMAKAVDLLRYSTKTIFEISDECGFSNSGHFINVCTGIFGKSPAALRRYFKDYARKYGAEEYKKSVEALWLYNWSEDELAEMKRISLGEI